jgi:spore coat polysaccharide biosynthesis predicted glycosyltransferase SpsG
MRFVLRADASQSIGAGHVMRSSAIAEELIARGEEVIFVGQISDLPWVEERITSLGFARIFIQTRDFIPRAESDVLLLDSYICEINDPFIDPENWLHIVAIVDELTPNYPCTLRIHPGLDSDWTGNSAIPILSGPKYIPFRSSLSRNIHTDRDQKQVLKIAVVAGGSDPHGLVNEIAKILSAMSEQFEAYLFSGPTFDSILDSRFFHVEVGPGIDEVTRDVDLVLTTASTSSLEFIARGLCVGIICAVNNQELYYNSLSQLGVAAPLGFRSSENTWDLDRQKISSLINSSELRENLTTRASGLIDFNGASRIVDAITNL